MNPRLPVRPFVTVGFVLLLGGSGLAGRAAGQVQFFTVALSGQAAPGTLSGVDYAAVGGLALNDAGQAMYGAGLAGSGVLPSENDVAFYAGSLTAPQLVARTGDAAPGTPAGVTYAELVALSLNDAGQVAYRAFLTGSGVTSATNMATYAGPLTAPQLVARTGDAAPGTPAGVTYAFFFDAPVLNDVGQAAYLAVLGGSGVTSANSEAIYAGPLSGFQLVARNGDAAPGTPTGVNYLYFNGAPALNDAGQVAYGAFLTGSGVTGANDQAIYAGPMAAPQLVARTGDAAPGTPTGVSYGAIPRKPVLSDAGQVAYNALLTGSGVTSANNLAIYAGPLAGPQLVARTGDAAPGMPVGVKYSFFGEPALNDAGEAAYYAFLSGSGVTSANNEAIFAGPLTAPQVVARTGDAAPGTPAGVNYASLSVRDSPAFNDAGQGAYLADLTGSGVTSANNRGLFLFDPTVGGLLIAREGDQFDVGGGELRTIKDFTIGFFAGRSDDELTGLSNDGTLGFSLAFTDGSSGVFTATIVPEPAALPLLVAGLTLVGCRSARGPRLL